MHRAQQPSHPAASPALLTHGLQDVAGDVVSCQLEAPQGPVAVQAVQQRSAPQESHVVPAQI